MSDISKMRPYVLRSKTSAFVIGRGTCNTFELRANVAQNSVKSITMTPAENFVVDTGHEVLFFPSGDVAHCKFEALPVEEPAPKILAKAPAHAKSLTATA